MEKLVVLVCLIFGRQASPGRKAQKAFRQTGQSREGEEGQSREGEEGKGREVSLFDRILAIDLFLIDRIEYRNHQYSVEGTPARDAK